MDSNAIEIASRVALFYVPFLFALCFHEYAHGWVAKKKGDRTAELMGRLTLNPVTHMDLVGTVVMPIMAIITGWPLFGWAKPVPVNERNLKHPKNDMFWIAIAGPLSNVLLAAVGSLALVLLLTYADQFSASRALGEMLKTFVFINLLLALFNMLPFHPLDGGKVLARFLPEHWNRTLEDNASTLNILLIIFFVMGGFVYLATPIQWLYQRFLMGAISFVTLFH